MRTALLAGPFDPWETLSRHQAQQDLKGRVGAAAVFVGTMRDFNQELSGITGMTLEHYPGMTERYLERIAEQATQRWDILDALIVHRCGRLHPDDPIVLVAAWSAHRGEAFAACRFLIEELKSRAPLWKKEDQADGERWVEHNTPA